MGHKKPVQLGGVAGGHMDPDLSVFRRDDFHPGKAAEEVEGFLKG